MIAQFCLMFALPALLAVAAAYDLATFTIPNLLSLVLAVAFAVFGFAIGLTPAGFSFHLLAGLIALVVGFALFAFGYIGGGDAKLFAAVALWLGLRDLLAYALAASLLGGLLTLALLALRQWPLPASLARRDWILKLHEKNSGIPYGVALASGALLILPHTEILHLAASV
ncbi:MAG TPA: prepilin peptidase [Rhizomicrobium sp.]|nr:prepilin peptidase [Rhizomicrobium sp.]